ncbi:MAG TPA: M50 family metallopeptidase [Candidatus Dormibacteraeota bacterium]|nr:M50 family metallopeptidase [Candidatus Dormibacteraeota bacterium]
MSTLLNWLLIAVGICGMFLMLIAPHEGGHFLAAKLFKVRVIEFSVGAGPKLLSVVRGGTLYAIRAFPILGYVRMGGMEAGDFEEPNGFHSKHPLQKIAILFAGPLANFLIAMLLIAGFELTQLNDDPGKIQRVLPGNPAAVAGLQVGDSVRTVNGKPVTTPGFISSEENAHPGQPLVLTGLHPDGKAFTITVTPACSNAVPPVCRIGVGVAPRVLTVQTAIQDGVSFPFVAVGSIVQGLDALVSGQVKGGLFGSQGLTGPIGIGAITGEAVTQGPPTYIFLVALLSVALGFTNLLPLLALDGGRIVIAVIEWIRRRPFDRNMELNFQRWGLVALLALAAIISFLDIQRLAAGQFTGIH